MMQRWGIVRLSQLCYRLHSDCRTKIPSISRLRRIATAVSKPYHVRSQPTGLLFDGRNRESRQVEDRCGPQYPRTAAKISLGITVQWVQSSFFLRNPKIRVNDSLKSFYCPRHASYKTHDS